ncbi:hypothetical protein [[Clostridium] symbiosum]|uniref:hypothetical protein n=1 Tax=Clostridium symbiosum TaxID=1512 RepID=UPI001AA17927|nr:hypothetical protein [[Clostridium] symbiosum]MBO1695213.1 hypothetical protein [[Clostridium] symbiosum]
MIFKLEAIEQLALKIEDYIGKNYLEDYYIERFSEGIPGGLKIPKIEEVLGNNVLREKLACFLMYHFKELSEVPRNQGVNLVQFIDEVGNMRCGRWEDEVLLACELNDVLKKTDFSHYINAGYIRAWDDRSDPVRRIYQEMENHEKRQELIAYLESHMEKGKVLKERIRNCIDLLEQMTEKERGARPQAKAKTGR